MADAALLLWILAATILDGLIALVGGVALFLKERTLGKVIMVLVGFSAGAMMGGAFFHLLPEALAESTAMVIFGYAIVGFVVFFLMEKLLHWHHCHDGHCEEHEFTHLVLFGDAVHNAIDGLVIAASFMVSIPFGIITTLIVIGHEIPQELGDMGVLLYGGMKKKRALFLLFLVQLTAVVGGVVGFMLSGVAEFMAFLLPFTAGGFLYIAASDLIPELHKEPRLGKSMISFAFFVIGVLFMFGVKIVAGG
jgi:zinc and cadmium transporter